MLKRSSLRVSPVRNTLNDPAGTCSPLEKTSISTTQSALTFYTSTTCLSYHMVDEATRFQATWFLGKVSSESQWSALCRYWIDVYMGPRRYHGWCKKEFHGQCPSSEADMLHITTKSIPVEAAHSISIVKGYHQWLRRAFNITRKESPGAVKKTFCRWHWKRLVTWLALTDSSRHFLCLARYIALVYLPTSLPHPRFKEQVRDGKQLSRCRVTSHSLPSSGHENPP